MNKEKISKLAFKKWEKENEERLLDSYEYYLNDTVLRDGNFNLKNTEDYWAWAEEEYQIEIEE
jgi:hypothetical protein